MPTPEVPRHIEIVLEYDRLFRSHLIYEAISLESLVDKTIAWYFTADESKHGVMFSLVFREGEIGFATKINILRKLLKKAYPDLKSAFGWFPKSLDELRALRNKFAHSALVLPEHPQEAELADGVTLRVLTRDGVTVDEFVSRATVDQQMEKCKHLLVVGLMLSILVEKRARGTNAQPEEDGFKAVAESLKLQVVGTA